MRLMILFIVMDLLALIAYPIVLIDGWVRRFKKPRRVPALVLS